MSPFLFKIFSLKKMKGAAPEVYTTAPKKKTIRYTRSSERERSLLSPYIYTHMALQQNKTEWLRSILLFNQTKNIATLFCLPTQNRTALL